MTRTEFFRDVVSWGRLREFCVENGSSHCDDVYSDAQRDDIIEEDLSDWVQDTDWLEVRRRLDGLDTGYDYWSHSDYTGYWTGLDDEDFEERKREVAEWADDYEIWDAEYAPPEEDDEFFDDESEDEDCSLGELFAASATCVQLIADKELEKAREEEQDYFLFMSAV
mgnify:CR=1 FL=1